MTLARCRNILKAQNDVGCTAYLVLNGSTTPGPHSLEETETCLRALMAAPGSLTKVNMLSDLLAQLHPSEGQFVVQLLTQDPRVRIQESLLEEALQGSIRRVCEEGPLEFSGSATLHTREMYARQSSPECEGPW